MAKDLYLDDNSPLPSFSGMSLESLVRVVVRGNGLTRILSSVSGLRCTADNASEQEDWKDTRGNIYMVMDVRL
jgi:hypothetical protein